MYNTRPFEFYVPPSATASEVRIHRETCTATYTRTINYAPGKHITLNESFLKQEIKRLQKELLMQPNRVDIKIKIIELQRELRKYSGKKIKKKKR